MANWRKVLVSGSNIEVNQISGSNLNLSGLPSSTADAGNQVLITDAAGNIFSTAQSNSEGVNQSFRIGQQTHDDINPITFDTSDLLLYAGLLIIGAEVLGIVEEIV